MLVRSSLVVMVLAGCGGNSLHHIPDAPPGTDDAAIDAAIDSPMAPVVTTLTATNGGAAVAGLTVYFQDASGALDTETTGSNGVATGMLPDGGNVTLVMPGPPDALVTWMGVHAGDSLAYNQPGAPISVTFEIPVDAVHAGITSYDVSTTCGVGTIPMPVSAGPPPTMLTQAIPLEGCGGDQELIVVGLNGSGAAVSSFDDATPGALTDGATIDLRAKTYTAAQARTYTWNDDSDGNLQVKDELLDDDGTVYVSSQFQATGIPVATASGTAPVSSYIDVVLASETADITQHGMAEWGQGATYTADWDAHKLPEISSAPVYDAATRQVSWGTDQGAIQPNLTELEISASRPSDQDHAWSWLVLGDNGPVTLPALPTAIYDWNIGAADTFSAKIGLANVPGDPAEARAVVLGPAGIAGLIHGQQATAGVVSTASQAPLQAVARSSHLPFFRR